MRRLTLLSLVAIGCGVDPAATLEGSGQAPAAIVNANPAPGPTQTADVEVENGLPYDGCTWLVHLGGQAYGLGAASKARLEAVVQAIGRTRVRIEYRVTGAQVAVPCGWGSSQTLPELELLSVTLPTQTAQAQLINGLPYDGCTWEVRINGTVYAPDAASQQRIEAFTQRIGSTAATVEYRLTGRQGSVACGWDASAQHPEVQLVSVSP